MRTKDRLIMLLAFFLAMPAVAATEDLHSDRSYGVFKSDPVVVMDEGPPQQWFYADYTVVESKNKNDVITIEIFNPMKKAKPLVKAGGDKNLRFFGLFRHFAFIDKGTAPYPRSLIIFDLKSKKEVYETEYAEPVEALADGRVTYWQETAAGTKENCPQYETGGAIETMMILNLKNLSSVKSSQTRCSQREH